jgi:hypothetical protein
VDSENAGFRFYRKRKGLSGGGLSIGWISGKELRTAVGEIVDKDDA